MLVNAEHYRYLKLYESYSSSFSQSILFNELNMIYLKAHCSLAVQAKARFHLHCETYWLPLIFDYFNNTFIQSVFSWLL